MELKIEQIMGDDAKGKSWLESIATMLENKGRLHSQTPVDFVSLANDHAKLCYMTFSINEFYKRSFIGKLLEQNM